jgi:hypothetical protein
MIGAYGSESPTPDGGSQGGTSASEAMERALDEYSVRDREMCLLYRRVYQSSSIQFTWVSLDILVLGGLTYLHCLWWCKKVRSSVRPADVVTACMACTTALIIIAERWNLATSSRDIFEALLQKTIYMVCNGSQQKGWSASLPASGTGLGMESQAGAGLGARRLYRTR